MTTKPIATKRALMEGEFSLYRNLFPYFIDFDCIAEGICLHIDEEQNNILNFNGIRIWVQDPIDGSLSFIKGPYDCQASSFHENFSDPCKPLFWLGTRTSSFRSASEVKAWWKITFPKPFHIAYIEFHNRLDVFGKTIEKIQFTAFTRHDESLPLSSDTQSPDTIKPTPQKTEQSSLVNLLQSAEKHYKNIPFDIQKSLSEEWQHVKSLLHPSAQSPETPQGEQSAFLHEQLAFIYARITAKIRQFPPDYNGHKESAWHLKAPNERPIKARYIRLVFWQEDPIAPWSSQLAIISQTPEGLSEEIEYSGISADTISADTKLIKDAHKAFLSQTACEAILDLGSRKEISEIKLWHESGSHQTKNLLRSLHVSRDKKNWENFGSNFDILAFAAYLNRIGLYLTPERKVYSYLVEFYAAFLSYFRQISVKNLVDHSKADQIALAALLLTIQDMGKSCRYHLPVIYAKHGLNTPLSLRDHAKLVADMAEFSKAVHHILGIQPFICYGTLLGAYRDQDFIAHDDDIDWAIVVEPLAGEDMQQTRQRILAKLLKHGMRAAIDNFSSLVIFCPINGTHMDLFLFYKQENTIKAQMEHFIIRDIIAENILPLTTLPFKGKVFYAPANISGFLLDRYGPGWVKSDPGYEV